MMLSSLLVAVTGTGAGLSFGMASLLYRNVLLTNKAGINSKSEKKRIQIILLVIITLGCMICYLDLGEMILNWSFMSMGLRGAVAFSPLCFALYFPQSVRKKYVLISMISGTGFTIVGKFILPSYVDPLFLGIFASILVMLIGYMMDKSENRANCK